MTIRFAASIVLGFVATTSAFAAEPAPATTPVATTTAAAAAARKADGDTRYCLRHARPVSRIMMKVCGTRRNLIDKGYDMDAVLTGAR